jgi:tetratricopeptide (TPR) repeat protein
MARIGGPAADPLSVRTQSFYATDLVYVRRYDDAIAAARAALRLQPDAPVARNALYQALFLKGMYDEALDLDKAQSAGDRELENALERGAAEAGYAGAQRRLAEVWSVRFGKPGGIRAFTLSSAALRGSRTAPSGPGRRRIRTATCRHRLPIYDPCARSTFSDLLRHGNRAVEGSGGDRHHRAQLLDVYPDRSRLDGDDARAVREASSSR